MDDPRELTDEQDVNRPVHPCLVFKGKGVKCEQCRVWRYEYCADWCASIPKLERFLRSKHPLWFSLDDIVDVIGSTFDGVHKGIDGFSGEKLLFLSWARAICNNKRIDYCRKKLKENDSVRVKLPFIPGGLPDLCNKSCEHIIFYPSKQIGTLTVISITLSDVVEKELLSLSPRPSWKKNIQLLKESRQIKIFKKYLEEAIITVSKVYNKSLRYENCEPYGILYAITPPLLKNIRDALLALSDLEQWLKTINYFEKSSRSKSPSFVVPITTNEDGDYSDGEDPPDETSNKGILTFETNQAIERLIPQIEKIDVCCAQLFRDELEAEKQGGRLKDLTNKYRKTIETLRQKKHRCLAKLHVHPDRKELILPGDLVVVKELVRVESKYLWCRLSNDKEISSYKKMDEIEIAKIRRSIEVGKAVVVRIMGFRPNDNGNRYFPTFSVLGGL